MNVILGYLIIYLSIVFGSISISTFFNKKIELCIGLDIIIKMILIYIFGLFGLLEVSVIIVNGISIVLGILTIFIYRKKVNIKENVLTYGLLFFTVTYFAFMIFTFYKVSERWDEYTYWSIISKKMFYTNELVNTGLKIIYPPFPTILQYFFNKVAQEYSQGREIFANIILGISLLLPLLSKIKKEKLLSKICVSIIILCIPAIFNTSIFYQAIYSDTLLGIMIGFILFYIYNLKDEWFKYIAIGISFIGITLTKPTGICISVTIIILLIIFYFINARNKIKGTKEKFFTNLKQNKKYAIAIIVFISIVLLTYGSYYMYSRNFVPEKNSMDKKIEEMHKDDFNSIGEAISTIKTTIFGSNESSFESDISNRTLLEDFHLYIAINNPIKISLIAFLFLYIVICMIIYKKYLIGEEKNRFKIFIISALIGFIIYALLIQLAYLVKFDPSERMRHASLNRYINTYYLGLFIVLISCIIDLIERKNKNTFNFLLLLVIILSITQLNDVTDATIAFGNNNTLQQGKLLEAKKEANYLKENLNQNEKIYFVNQESNLEPKTGEIKYLLYPEIELIEADRLTSEMEKIFKENEMFEIWKNMLYNDFNYLYIYKFDSYFKEFSENIFDNETIKEKTLYKIEKENENIKLIEIKREKN